MVSRQRHLRCPLLDRFVPRRRARDVSASGARCGRGNWQDRRPGPARYSGPTSRGPVMETAR